MGRRGQVVALLLLGLFAAASAMLIQQWMFPLYSLNRDDSVYVAMAGLLAERGEVTLAASGHEAFRPWASAVLGDRIVMKYSPPWPAVLAAADLLAGATWIGLGVTAAMTAVLMSLLAAEVLQDRVAGLVAGLLLAVSPVFVVQSGTYLPYVFQLGLGLGFALLLLSGVRCCSTPRVVGAGAVMGVAFWARPFDALIVALPFVVYAVTEAWRDRRSRQPGWSWWGCLLRLAAGGFPLLVLSLVYNAAVMGSPLWLPYMATGPQDGFGFGQRGVFPEFTSEFTASDGLQGLVVNLRWLPSWTVGGIVLVLLATIGLASTTGRARWAVAALGAVVPLAYLPFWGPHAIGVAWDGIEHFGSFYYLPVLVPLVTFAAAALVALARHCRSGAPQWVRPLTGVVVAVMLLLTVLAIPDKVSANLAVRDDFRALEGFVDQQQIGTGVLLLPTRGNLGFVSSSPFLENKASLDQPVLYAETRGPLDFELVDRYPDRQLYRLTQELPPDRTTGGKLRMDLLRVDSGPTLTLRLRVSNPTDRLVAVAYLAGTGNMRFRTLDVTSTSGESYDVYWTLVPPRADAATAAVADAVRLPAPSASGVLAVGLEVRGPGDAPEVPGRRWELRMPYRVVAGGTRLELLRPGQAWSIDDAAGASWQQNATGSPVLDLAG